MVSRPLSPHLQIYRPMLTMALSIIHRLTGAALYFGTLLLVGWVFATAMGPEAYADYQAIAGSILGRVVLFGFTWAAIHHMLGGIRHLVWDTGRGFRLPTVEFSARLILAASLSLTVAVWVLAYWIRG